MRTVEEVVVDIETKHGVRFYGKEKEMIGEALRSYAQEIREECAKIAQWSDYASDIPHAIRSMEIK